MKFLKINHVIIGEKEMKRNEKKYIFGFVIALGCMITIIVTMILRLFIDDIRIVPDPFSINEYWIELFMVILGTYYFIKTSRLRFVSKKRC